MDLYPLTLADIDHRRADNVIVRIRGLSPEREVNKSICSWPINQTTMVAAFVDLTPQGNHNVIPTFFFWVSAPGFTYPSAIPVGKINGCVCVYIHICIYVCVGRSDCSH